MIYYWIELGAGGYDTNDIILIFIYCFLIFFGGFIVGVTTEQVLTDKEKSKEK